MSVLTLHVTLCAAVFTYSIYTLKLKKIITIEDLNIHKILYFRTLYYIIFIFIEKNAYLGTLPLSAHCFLIAQAEFFICCTTTVALFLGIIILLKFHVPSRDFFLKVLQNVIVY